MDTTNLKLEDLPEAVSEILVRLEKIEEQLNNLQPLEKEEEEEFINVNQAANFLQIAKSTLYGKIFRGEIPCYKPGQRLYFSKQELVGWIKSKPINKIT